MDDEQIETQIIQPQDLHTLHRQLVYRLHRCQEKVTDKQQGISNKDKTVRGGKSTSSRRVRQ